MRLFARTTTLTPLLIAAVAFGAESGTALSKQTPFGASRGMGGPNEAAGEIIEFAAVSTIGKKTELVFFDKTTKKNHWIMKGETAGGISLLNYDSVREQAVVKINGVEKTLTLRKSHGVAGPGRSVAAVPTGFNVPSPAITSAPAGMTAGVLPLPPIPVPAGPATPETQARQETEARMLVSDLLEIGMAQRAAYEAKQKQAGSGGNDAAAQMPVPDPTGAPPKS